MLWIFNTQNCDRVHFLQTLPQVKESQPPNCITILPARKDRISNFKPIFQKQSGNFIVLIHLSDHTVFGYTIFAFINLPCRSSVPMGGN